MRATVPTAEALAEELNRVGLSDLAKRARQNEFHDYWSPHTAPEMVLISALATCAKRYPSMSAAIMGIRADVIAGKYDASHEESEEWANSPEGKAVFAQLTADIVGQAHRRK